MRRRVELAISEDCKPRAAGQGAASIVMPYLGMAGLKGPPYSPRYWAPVGRAGILMSFARSMSGLIAMSMKPTIISSHV